MTTTIAWGRSARDGLLHAWTAQRWAGDAVALCQHTCPPQRVDCAGHGQPCPECDSRAGLSHD